MNLEEVIQLLKHAGEEGNPITLYKGPYDDLSEASSSDAWTQIDRFQLIDILRNSRNVSHPAKDPSDMWPEISEASEPNKV